MDNRIDARRSRLEALASRWSDADIDRLADAALRRQTQRRQRKVAALAGVGAVAVAVAAALVFFDRDPRPNAAKAVAVAGDTAVESPTDQQAMDRGGTPAFEALTPDTAVKPVEASGDTGTVAGYALSAGAARFSGDAVEVTVLDPVAGGTAVVTGAASVFVVRRDVAGVAVTVQEGEVTVTHGGRSVRVAAAEAWHTASETADSLADAREPGVDDAPVESTGGRPTKRMAWRGLAERGDHNAAFKRLSAGPMPKGARDRMLAADTARRSGHHEAAPRYLKAIIEQTPRHALAPVAAFTLGRVYLEKLGRPSDAAKAFAQVRSLAPKSPLAPDALARQVAAHRRAGQTTQAKAAAQRYLAQYPAGRHRAKVTEAL